MDYQQFEQAVIEFYQLLDNNPPASDTINSWYPHLKHIKLSSMLEIFDRMAGSLEKRPFNMLAKIKEYAAIWLVEHPEGKKEMERTSCADCSGNGYFSGRMDGKQYTILCGRCENWRHHFGTAAGKLRLTVAEAEYHGYKVS